MFTLRSASVSGDDMAPVAAGVLVARQPIFDRQRAVCAYELLYRGAGAEHAEFRDGDRATASVVTGSFLDIGIDRIAEGRPAFINATREFLVSRAAMALPAERVVLEVLEDVQVDDVLVAAVAELAAAGFRIALDDFVFEERWRPLLALAHVVKIDVLALGLEGVREHVALLTGHGVELLAEKVETEAQYEALHALGFHYFQGYFFAKPNVMSGTRAPVNRNMALTLLAELQDRDADMERIADLVAREPGLSYRLLRFINSAALALPVQVTSIQRAVVMMGLAAVKRVISMLVLASREDKPTELTRMTLVRARMSEQLCAAGGGDAATGFTVGLFSTLDAFMDRPLPELLAELPLSRDVTAALMEGEGAAGEALQCALAYERGHWDGVRFHGMGLAMPAIAAAYNESSAWADAALAAGA